MGQSNNPIHVRFDARMIGHSGIGTQVFNVLKLLSRRKEVQLHLLGNPDQIQKLLPAYKGPVTEFTAGVYSPLEHLKFPAPLAGELLHCPHYNAPIPYLKKSLVVVHDLIHLQSQEFAKPHYRLYSYILLWLVTRFARHIATVSDTTRLELLKRFPRAAGKTSVLYNGINHDLFGPRTVKECNAFRRQYNLPPAYILSVGIGKKHKNVDFIIKAMAPAWHAGELKTPLVIAGTGGRLPDYVSAVVRDLNVRDYIIVLPYLEEEELPLLYASARVFLFPSILEGFGFPLVEAMACGTPVLASNASCLPEIGADAAHYFDPRDTQDFMLQLQTILKSSAQRNRMREQGLKRARHFSWKKHVNQLLKIYHQLNGGPDASW